MSEEQIDSESPSNKGVALVLMTASAERNELEGFLEDAGFHSVAVSTESEAIETIVSHSPCVFLHEWELTSQEEATRLHRKLCTDQSFVELVRVVLVDEVSPQMLAMANDYQIDRLISDEALMPELLEIIQQAIEDKDESLEFEEILGDPSDDGEYDQMKMDESIEAAYEQYPENARVKMEYATLLVRRGDFESSEELARELIAADANDVRAMNLLARVYMKQTRFERAIEILEKANILSPAHPDRLALIGDAFYEKGELDSAQESYEDALEADPDHEAAHNGLGLVHFNKGDVEEALKSFRKCLSEDETASFFNNAAVLAIKSEKTAEALRLYETALKSLKTPSYAHMIYFNIALAFFRIDEHDQGMEALRTALEYEPNYEKALRLLKKKGGEEEAS